MNELDKLHPMKQIAIMSVIQVILLGSMGLSMYLIGLF